MVQIYYIYGEPDYYIYCLNVITFMASITVTVDYCIYG